MRALLLRAPHTSRVFSNHLNGCLTNTRRCLHLTTSLPNYRGLSDFRLHPWLAATKRAISSRLPSFHLPPPPSLPTSPNTTQYSTPSRRETRGRALSVRMFQMCMTCVSVSVLNMDMVVVARIIIMNTYIPIRMDIHCDCIFWVCGMQRT